MINKTVMLDGFFFAIKPCKFVHHVYLIYVAFHKQGASVHASVLFLTITMIKDI